MFLRYIQYRQNFGQVSFCECMNSKQSHYTLLNLMSEQLYEVEEENGIRTLIPKPLELLPQPQQLIEPKFAIVGLTQLCTNRKFRSQELYDALSQKGLSKINISQQLTDVFVGQTVYQKYEGFDTSSYCQKCIVKCRMNHKRQAQPYIANKLVGIEDKRLNLRFQSKFEFGNLGRASKINDSEYNLLIDNDINTGGFTQWFFFRVEVDKPCLIKFNVLNFRKKHSLHEQGMKICVYSNAANQKQEVGWVRGGTNIKYTRNNLHFGSHKNYYTLSFNYHFKSKMDQVFFSYHYPYTYSDLVQFLKSLDEFKFVKRNLLCLTPCKNKVHYLTITENNPLYRPLSKKVVFLFARTHPGQTIGSFVIQRVIKYLTSNQKQAIQLRNTYIFKIIPMVNPDGVLHGNSRCSLAGRDLNRSWDKIDQFLFPEIHHIKSMILLAHRQNRVHLICDFHGHSLKKDAFIYGCHKKSQPFSTRQFPWVFSRICKNFSYKSSAFCNSTDKFGTARVSLFKTLKLPNIFTLETSFCGPSKSNMHWTEDQLKDIARSFCLTLFTLGPKPKIAETSELIQQQQIQKIQYLTQFQKQSLLSELYKDPQNFACNLKSEFSTSDIQEDYIDLNFDQQPIKSKQSQPILLDRKREKSGLYLKSQTPNKQTKLSLGKGDRGKSVINDRLSQFDNIKFWVDNGRMKMNSQFSKEFHDEYTVNRKKRAFYSRTESLDTEPVPMPLKSNQMEFNLLKIQHRLPLPKTPEKKKQLEIHKQVIVIKDQHSRGSPKQMAVASKMIRCPKRFAPIYRIPQHKFNQPNSRTQFLRKHELNFDTNFIKQSQTKIFQKQLIEKIDRRLQDYIQIHKINRFNDGSKIQ